MLKRIFFPIIAIVLLLVGCVKIPEHHSTVGKYNELRDINTECTWKSGFSNFNTSAAPQQAGELNSRSFKVLVWNSYKGSNKGWQEDFERLSSYSDLIVLQEGYLTDDLKNLLNTKQYSWDIARAFTYYDIYAGVLTASRVKPDFLCSFRIFEPLSGIPKTVLITRYPLSGTAESLLLANIHMINFSLDIGAYRGQLEQLAHLLSQHQGPLIISGDFNSWSAERMGILTAFMQELGAKAVAFDTDNRVRYMGFTIDHIYYRQLLPVEAISEKVKTSDHNPMMVTFKLAGDV